MNGDILTKINLVQFLNFHNTNEAEISLCGIEYFHQSPYGVIDIDGIRLNQLPKNQLLNI